MKKNLIASLLVTTLAISLYFLSAFAMKTQDEGYILEHEKDIAASQPGPHKGGGLTTAYSFFSKDKNSKLAFRKRILHAGSSIGYHLQKENEIYYILSGTGRLKMNGKTLIVTAGDAILTKPGSSHGLEPEGKEDLVLIINYELD